jgi:GWxTD domain-containing protein
LVSNTGDPALRENGRRFIFRGVITMSNLHRLILCVSFFTFAASGTLAQQNNKKTASDDPNEKPRKVTSEMNDAQKRWVYEDVPYIITDAEREAFLKLKTNEEREAFIQAFWDRRDPTPDTEENEFRDEYYERIAYANEHYSSGVPGWKTDRGRIYIRWGKPDEIDAHSSGGNYNRPSYEGGGSITTYPFETWFYRHLEGVGDGIEVEFVDPTGTGEYRIARDPNEKNVQTAGLGASSDSANGAYQREQDSQFRRQEILVGIESPPSIKFSDLNKIASGDSGALDTKPLQFDLRVDYFRLSDDRVITAFTVQTENKELSFKENGSLQTATMNILGRITSISNKRTGIFEDAVTTDTTVQDLAQRNTDKSVYQKALALAPGTYKIDLVVRDVATGNTGLVNMGFTVPKYDPAKLSTSTLILASNLRTVNTSDIGRMFVIGKDKVLPNVSGTFKKGQPVGVYLQVYNAGIDQTTLRPAIDVDYIVSRDGKEISRIKEDWSGLSDSGQRLTLAKQISTDKLASGTYDIAVVIRDHVGTQTIENKGKFTIEP